MTMIASTIFFLTACPPMPAPTPPVTDAGSDAAPFGTYDCDSWCAHARDMKCPASLPTDHGASCVDVCKNTLGTPLYFDVQCRTLATSCEAVDACENRMRSMTAKSTMTPDTEEASRATCAGWCSHAAALKCPSAKPTPKGAPCIEVCINVQSGPVKFNLKCRVTAPTCALADACER